MCELAAAVAKVFNQNGIDYHVTFGSLLGVARSGKEEDEEEEEEKKNKETKEHKGKEEEKEGEGDREEEKETKDSVVQNDAAPSNTQ